MREQTMLHVHNNEYIIYVNKSDKVLDIVAAGLVI